MIRFSFLKADTISGTEKRRKIKKRCDKTIKTSESRSVDSEIFELPNFASQLVCFGTRKKAEIEIPAFFITLINVDELNDSSEEHDDGVLLRLLHVLPLVQQLFS